MDIESKNKSVLWDYYQVLVKTHGFNGITDLITKFHALEAENARLRAEIDAANAQQLPAVAVPEWVMSAIKRNLCPAESCDFHGNQDPYLSGGCCKPELQKAISYLESLPSPRITEQELIELAEWVLENHTDHDTSGSRSHDGRIFCLDCRVYERSGEIKHTEQCIVSKCRALLNKLNGVHHE